MHRPMMAHALYLPTPPFKRPSGGMKIGMSQTTSRDTNTANFRSRAEGFVGHQSVSRVYANDTYGPSNSFMSSSLCGGDWDSSKKVSIRTTHLSWNPDLSLLQSENTPNASTQFSGFDPSLGFNAWKAGGYVGTVTGYGTETTKNIMGLRTIPDAHKVILNPCHEADEYQADRTYGSNYGMFRNGFRIICDIIHAFGNSNWKTCLLLTAFGFKGSGGTDRLPSNFWPDWSGVPGSGLKYVDIMGTDIYNEGGLSASRWDSFSCSFGMPLDSQEALLYQLKYGGTNGWKTSDSGSGETWTNGFFGWMKMKGIKQYCFGEVGTHVNHESIYPSWCSLLGLNNSKNDWLRSVGIILANLNSDSTNPQCVAVCYFQSAGRTYQGQTPISKTASGLQVDPAKSLHKQSDGSLVVCTTGAATSSALPTTGNSSGDMAWVPSSGGKGAFWTWNGSAWTDAGIPGIAESWQQWWGEKGVDWDGIDSSWYAWKDVTTWYGLTG